MNIFYRKNKFTFLELMIAVIIFLIVSVVITAVYRTTLNAYKRGTEYSDISQSLSGTFLVMENDLSKLVTINDKESVFFNPDEFSFISVGTGQDKYSFLRQVKYKLQDNMLLRSSAKYPDDIVNIDRDPVLFLNNIDETNFKYIYAKEEKKKKKNSSDNKENLKDNQENSQNSSNDNDNSSDNENGKNKISKDDEADSNIKIPIGVTISGIIKEKKIIQDFQTTLFIPQFKIQKMSKSKDDKKDKDKNSDNKSNSNNSN